MAPLDGVKIVEFGSIGPGPFAAMVLSDLGATVIRLRRAGEKSPVDIGGSGADHRGRPGLVVDLKKPEDVELALRLLEGADALIEGFRPGVMERLGLGPDVVHARNPRVVYGRMTGYGQTGPLARTPGHDINYAAISGVLSTIGRQDERPVAPINLLADYGGGGMLLAMGILAALFEARRDGVGPVVDAAMVDGVAQLATIVFSFANAGAWGPRGSNVLDSGAPFYDVYETADGKYFAVGAIEPQFYAALLDGLGIPADEMPQWDRQEWPAQKNRLTTIFKTRTRDEWTTRFHDSDACATPVLDLDEAPHHPHNAARSNFVLRDHGLLPASAPRFGTDAPQVRQTPALEDVLSAFGLGSEAASLAARAR
ncbi:MAG: Carnitine dehydratase [Mycobacterium sp.]|jgi:alpha-methylacyl-CoA racemase|nr:Carnitine dehydratase [Mycobacterium sp.]